MEHRQRRLAVAAEAVERDDSGPLTARCERGLDVPLFRKSRGHAGERREIRCHEAAIALEGFHLVVDRRHVRLEPPLPFDLLPLAFVRRAEALRDGTAEPVE